MKFLKLTDETRGSSPDFKVQSLCLRFEHLAVSAVTAPGPFVEAFNFILI
jgi:hypothetical protein